jgi:hypothetical protein
VVKREMPARNYQVTISGRVIKLYRWINRSLPAKADTDFILVRFKWKRRHVEEDEYSDCYTDAEYDYLQDQYSDLESEYHITTVEGLDDGETSLCRYPSRDIRKLLKSPFVSHVALYPSKAKWMPLRRHLPLGEQILRLVILLHRGEPAESTLQRLIREFDATSREESKISFYTWLYVDIRASCIPLAAKIDSIRGISLSGSPSEP